MQAMRQNKKTPETPKTQLAMSPQMNEGHLYINRALEQGMSPEIFGPTHVCRIAK